MTDPIYLPQTVAAPVVDDGPMHSTFSLYDDTTGLFLNRHYVGSVAGVVDMLHVLPHVSFHLGEYDHLSQRVDLETGAVVDYVPEKPFPSATWDAETKRWVYTPGAAEALYTAQQAAIKELNDTYAMRLSWVTAGYPDEEVTSWSKQESEARAWTADNSAPTPFLSALCAVRGVPLAYLIGKVIEKADLFASVTGTLIGSRQHAEDRLDAATTPAEVVQTMTDLFPDTPA